MTDKPVQYREIAHLPLGDRIDLVCDAFERERRRGLVRPLEEYVKEVPEPEREAFLSELRTVEQALSDASTVMEGEPRKGEMLAGEATRSLARPLDEPPEPTVPSQLGRYEVEELLGRGGFGEVWKCFDPELKRHVAVKVLLRERFASDQEVARFLGEAHKLAQLRHPGIVAIHDVGCQGGYVFLVSEYVPGGTLHDRLQKGPLPPAEAAELLAKVAEAVHYAHKRGLVHRDLKPGNILIDAEGQPRVADFGLAVHEDEQRRRAGEIAGTPAYMSPEQVRGETHLLDGRADIWAIGVILYQSLTGRRPFNGNTREDLFEEILHREPKPPRQFNDGIPPTLELVCLGCLHKPLADRPLSAADVARQLRSRATRTSKWAWSAAIAAALGLLAVFLWYRPNRTADRVAPQMSALELITTADEWVPFLNRVRQRVVYDEYSASSVDHFEPTNNTYHFSQASTALVAFGQAQARAFDLRMSVANRDWVGYTGFFWALRDDSDAYPDQLRKCYVLEFGRLKPTAERLTVRILEAVIAKDDNGIPYIRERDELCDGIVTVPIHTELVCRISARCADPLSVSLTTVDTKSKTEVTGYRRPFAPSSRSSHCLVPSVHPIPDGGVRLSLRSCRCASSSSAVRQRRCTASCVSCDSGLRSWSSREPVEL